ncbi:hypothetical protein LTR27_007184 [Elasticomyces elasticus]|nr:hypothetical protein LTR27_007184 [Elasticomyces elasticus]
MSAPPPTPSAYAGLGSLARGGRWRARGHAARRAMREARAAQSLSGDHSTSQSPLIRRWATIAGPKAARAPLPLPLRAARASTPRPIKAIRAPSPLSAASRGAMNFEVTDNSVTQAATLVERLTRYRFKNLEHMREALHISGVNTLPSNRRLALVGDSVLRQILIDNWYPSGAKNGRASSILTEVASNASLAAVANRIGIRQFVKTDQSTVSGYTLATTIEAILDSDKDWTVAKEVMDGFGLAPTILDAVPDQVTPTKEEMTNDAGDEFAAPTLMQRRPPVNVNVSVSSSGSGEPISVNVSVQVA